MGPLQRTHPTGDGYGLTTEEPAQAKAASRDVQQLGSAASDTNRARYLRKVGKE